MDLASGAHRRKTASKNTGIPNAKPPAQNAAGWPRGPTTLNSARTSRSAAPECVSPAPSTAARAMSKPMLAAVSPNACASRAGGARFATASARACSFCETSRSPSFNNPGVPACWFGPLGQPPCHIGLKGPLKTTNG
ncbi:hypothetical protein LzC2_40970 [Planctomycetes bacterium LzC2]|uniref:Uncharacterized protein n=1 Tax=Alienimonas chondri TaxID=2681879 RepID=A0ABX1VIS3_9PLAN|nr:hypothetical protein [Alienimonas chondri]